MKLYEPIFQPDVVKEAFDAADRYYDTRQQLLEVRLNRMRLVAKASNVVNLADYRMRRTQHEQF